MAGRVEVHSELEALNVQIGKVEIEIKAVEQKIDNVEKELEGQENQTEKEYLRKEKEQLRKKEEQLRKKEEQLRKKEELLIQERMQIRSGSGFQNELGQSVDQETTSTKAISDCGVEEAENLLRSLGITSLNGHQKYPIDVPAGTPECLAFDYSLYASEDEGTPAMCQHHKQQLERMGVKMCNDGLDVFDTHTQKGFLTLKVKGKKYRGNCDACVSPFGLKVSSAVYEMRVVYEHKQSSEAKNENRRSRGVQATTGVNKSGQLQGGELQVGKESANKLLSKVRAQGCIQLLAAYASCNFPLILDLTDGTTHHVSQLKGKNLIAWDSLTPTQAYYVQARHLMDQSLSKVVYDWGYDVDRLEDIPEELSSPVKKLKTYSGSEHKLRDHLSFLMSFPEEERLKHAMDYVSTLNLPPLPPDIAHMYGW